MLETIRDYCLAMPAVTEHTPFDDRTLVFKVLGKMFCLIDMINAESINVKCEPERATALREQHSSVLEGYHMHKKQWNTVMLNEGLPLQFVFEQINHSYQEVVKKMPKKLQLELQNL
jgi:predicted DNA-binding protein (MmcQ/YjbR family)